MGMMIVTTTTVETKSLPGLSHSRRTTRLAYFVLGRCRYGAKALLIFLLFFFNCFVSIKAKGVLDGIGADYTVVELDTDPDGKAIRAEMADLVGRTSVPAIWIDSKFVGGYVRLSIEQCAALSDGYLSISRGMNDGNLAKRARTY